MKFGTCITTLNNFTLMVRTTLASTESYRLLIKYACCKGQDLSENKSSKLYGFSITYKQESKINSALNDLKKMKEAVDLLAKLKDKAVLEGFGLTCSDEESSVSQLPSAEDKD